MAWKQGKRKDRPYRHSEKRRAARVAILDYDEELDSFTYVIFSDRLCREFAEEFPQVGKNPQ